MMVPVRIIRDETLRLTSAAVIFLIWVVACRSGYCHHGKSGLDLASPVRLANRWRTLSRLITSLYNSRKETKLSYIDCQKKRMCFVTSSQR
jgi:hypothetical protein